MNGLTINGVQVNTPAAKPYEQIRLSPADVASIEHKTFFAIAPMECKLNLLKHTPEPYKKRVIHLRHKLGAEPGHIYRLNIANPDGKDSTWFYHPDGLTITEC